MKKFLLCLVTLFALTSCTDCRAVDTQPATPTIQAIHGYTGKPDRDSAVRIVIDKKTKGSTSTCSATIVGVRTLLTAAHCFWSSLNTLSVNNGKPVVIERLIQDNNDHSLVLLTDIVFDVAVSYGPPPIEGDNIHYWGNPYSYSMMLRRGYVSGFSGYNTIYDVNGYHGDSGAGIFNDNHQLVGVISFISNIESFELMGSYPLNFTPEQLQSVGVAPTPYLSSGTKAVVNLKKE